MVAAATSDIELLLRAMCGLAQRMDLILRQGPAQDPRSYPPLRALVYDVPLDRTPVVIAAGAVLDVPLDRVPQGARGVIARLGLNVTGAGAGFSQVTTVVLVNGVQAGIFRNGPIRGVFGPIDNPTWIPPIDLVEGDVPLVRFANTDVAPQNIGARIIAWYWWPEEVA
jgi:hypothetical protein